jgi:hypothetical protein
MIMCFKKISLLMLTNRNIVYTLWSNNRTWNCYMHLCVAIRSTWAFCTTTAIISLIKYLHNRCFDHIEVHIVISLDHRILRCLCILESSFVKSFVLLCLSKHERSNNCSCQGHDVAWTISPWAIGLECVVVLRCNHYIPTHVDLARTMHR